MQAGFRVSSALRSTAEARHMEQVRGTCFVGATSLLSLALPFRKLGTWRRLFPDVGKKSNRQTQVGEQSRNVSRRYRRGMTTAVLRPRVAVVGGGFGGLFTALKLAQLPWTRLTRPEITLIDRADRFSFLPMMYELATGEVEAWEVAPRFDTLLDGVPISFLQATAQSMSFGDSPKLDVIPAGSSAKGPTEIHFDRAVLALGSEPASREAVPGAAEHALALFSHDDALALRDRLNELQKTKSSSSATNVVVVGGGFAGVETAACVAEKLGSAGSVILVDRGDRILSQGDNFNRLAAERVLSKRGVVIEYRKLVSSVSADSITLMPDAKSADASAEADDLSSVTLSADLVIWTAGSAPSAAVASLGVPLVESTGRFDVDDLLQVRGHEDLLFALGDAASVPASDANAGYAGTAQVAMQQAEYAAWNVWASLTGRKKLRYRYVQLGEMIVLGSREASVATVLGVETDGLAGWAMRRAAYAARMPTDRHRARVAASWAVAPLVSDVMSTLNATSCLRTSDF